MSDYLRRLVATLRRPAVWVPLALICVATGVFWTTNLDVALAQRFFSGQPGTSPLFARWPLMAAQPWKCLYDFGVYPALALGIGGLIMWLASFLWPRLVSMRDPGLFLGLALLIGPGLLVNCCLKPYWSRPRPREIQNFHGSRQFVPVLQRGDGEYDASFPSGHAAMGFFLLTPAFFLYPRRPRWALVFLLLGVTSGLTIGAARVVAGGHFASDVLWSGTVVYFTGLILAIPFGFARWPNSTQLEHQPIDRTMA